MRPKTLTPITKKLLLERGWQAVNIDEEESIIQYMLHPDKGYFSGYMLFRTDYNEWVCELIMAGRLQDNWFVVRHIEEAEALHYWIGGQYGRDWEIDND